MRNRVRRTTAGAAPWGRRKRVTLGVAALAVCLPLSVAPRAQPAERAEGVHVVEGAHRLLTVHVRNTPLKDVLDEIAEQTGLVVEGHATSDSRITIDLEALSLEAVLPLIMGERSYALQYGREPTRDGARYVKVPRRLRLFDDERAPARDRWSRRDLAVGGRDDDTVDPARLGVILEHSDNAWDREDAVEVLAESEHPEVAVPLVGVALVDPDQDVRWAAVEALATLGGDQAADLLQAALRDEEMRIREGAIEALETLGGDHAVRSLGVALQDSDADLRERAVDALGYIGNPGAIQFLEYVWAADENASVREAAASWLEELTACASDCD